MKPCVYTTDQFLAPMVRVLRSLCPPLSPVSRSPAPTRLKTPWREKVFWKRLFFVDCNITGLDLYLLANPPAACCRPKGRREKSWAAFAFSASKSSSRLEAAPTKNCDFHGFRVSQWGKRSGTVGKVERRPWFPAFAGKTGSD